MGNRRFWIRRNLIIVCSLQMQSEFDQDVPKDDQGGSAGSDGLTVIKWIKMAS